MPEPMKPFKEYLDADAVGRLAMFLTVARPEWNHGSFVAMATEGLGALELKDRVRHVAKALAHCLDQDYALAVAHVHDALPPPLDDPENPLKGFAMWPLCQWIEDVGLDHWELSMNLMHKLTSRFSCEFAVRPFLIKHPQRTLDQLREWATDPDQHVRRWVSEGSRPRLPWGQQLKRFVNDPTPVFELLELLKGDPEEYVRRSVANNLNDIAKDHPQMVIDTTKRWMKNADNNRKRLVKHALRTLIKQGNPGALAVLGYGTPEIRASDICLTPLRLAFGNTLSISLDIQSLSTEKQPLIIDYAVHHVKANGTTSRKVFKWSTRTVSSKQTIKLSRNHRIKPISTRRYYNGIHTIEIMVNGVSVGSAQFELYDVPQKS